MKHSLYHRQFALVAALLLLSFAVLGTAFAALSYHYTLTEKQEALTRDAENISEIAGSMLSQGMNLRSEFFQLYVTSTARSTDAHVILAESDGRILYCAGSEETYLDFTGETLPMGLLSQVKSTGSYSALSSLNGLFPDQQYVAATPITVRTAQFSSGDLVVVPTQVGVVVMSVSASALTEMWRAFASIFLFTAVVVLFIAFLATSATSMYQIRPLKEMVEATKKFSHGEFDTRVEVGDRQDEVGELAVAFNNMAQALAAADAERSQFIANVSHELKTPMTTIAGFAEGILDGTIPPEKQRDALQTVSAETRRLSRLVRRMLDVSRMQAEGSVVAQERFDVSEVLLRVLVSLEGKITEHQLDVETDLPEEPVWVWGDPDSITQVCYNLLDNAIKFAAPGTALGLSISRKGTKAYVAIRNVGESIPPEELGQVFDRFHKTDHSRSVDRDGVGLGLYIVKTILDSHKENITVTSQEGVTEFTFTLTQAI